MKKSILLPLLLLVIPFSGTAQDDDLYFVPKKVSKENVIGVQSSTPNRVEKKYKPIEQPSMRDVDEYNRRQPNTSEQYSNDDNRYNGDESINSESMYYDEYYDEANDDFSMSSRIMRFHSPSVTIAVSSPYYWDLMYNPYYNLGWNRFHYGGFASYYGWGGFWDPWWGWNSWYGWGGGWCPHYGGVWYPNYGGGSRPYRQGGHIGSTSARRSYGNRIGTSSLNGDRRGSSASRGVQSSINNVNRRTNSTLSTNRSGSTFVKTSGVNSSTGGARTYNRTGTVPSTSRVDVNAVSTPNRGTTSTSTSTMSSGGARTYNRTNTSSATTSNSSRTSAISTNSGVSRSNNNSGNSSSFSRGSSGGGRSISSGGSSGGGGRSGGGRR